MSDQTLEERAAQLGADLEKAEKKVKDAKHTPGDLAKVRKTLLDAQADRDIILSRYEDAQGAMMAAQVAESRRGGKACEEEATALQIELDGVSRRTAAPHSQHRTGMPSRSG